MRRILLVFMLAADNCYRGFYGFRYGAGSV